MLTEECRRKMLEYPPKPVKIMLDTDVKNEIDDQFAIVYTLLSSNEVTLKAINTAPFTKKEYPDSALGMEASYQEILNVLEKMSIKKKVPNLWL